jgi:hypothetical protein
VGAFGKMFNTLSGRKCQAGKAAKKLKKNLFSLDK